MITVQIITPSDYSEPTKSKMISAGLSKIENYYEHDEDFSHFHSTGETKYFFDSGFATTDPKVFRKKVYNYQ